ncbi:MAG: alpha/beta hydrolase [Rhodospirillaceae bacterium]|jgi:arylformamidase|nr:alpha/beta hydrolase [Rhodospirillaceae bacterium]MBT5457555.1 alpha/beta hydrolase [Rhodospirillaceae bacterium]
MEPKIYLDYTQEELDQQYEHRSFVPDGDDFLARTEADSDRVRAAADGLFDVAYGPGADQLLDIYPAGRGGMSPVVVFFHGGRWSRGGKTSNVESLAMYNAAGVNFVSVGFTLIPEITMDGLIGQCRDAIAWLWHNARTFGGDPERLFVTGKSSGGHLAGMMVTTDWAAERRLPAEIIKGGLLVSGMYDLEPVRLSFRNGFLGLDEDTAMRNSPIHHIPAGGCPLVVGFGSLETDEFRRQGRAFATAWAERGLTCRLVELEGRHHYSINTEMSDACSDLMVPFLEHMGNVVAAD